MKWNWQQKDWPIFQYKRSSLEALEAEFLLESGVLFGAYKHIKKDDQKTLIIDLISDEAIKTSEIEGEFFNRDSVQSSIRRHFGLASDFRKIQPAEQGIAELMIDLYHNFSTPLTHDILFHWHSILMSGRQDLQDMGAYRTHIEPMQIVSGAIHKPKIHFEAPPSNTVPAEMEAFIQWFNDSAPNGDNPLPPLTRSGITHLYFACIHPFEDGNGRIARALAEKTLSQHFAQPTLISLSTVIQQDKKSYYDELAHSNKHNEITNWLSYFAQTILAAQKFTQCSVDFLIEKTKLYDRVGGQLNKRQTKVLERVFHEGVNGFKGGMSAEKYIRIAKTSRATATRDLQDLVTKGVLVRSGELKKTRYWIAFMGKNRVDDFI